MCAPAQDVRHIEVDLGDSGLKYVPGDSLGVWPETPATAVDEFLQLCGLEGSAYVVVNGSSGTPVRPNPPSSQLLSEW